MRSSKWWGLRGGVRVLAVFTITVVTVLALATAAGAEEKKITVTVWTGSRDGLRQSCADAKGNANEGDDTFTTCNYPSGTVTTCTNNTKDNCTSVTPAERKLRQSLLNDIRAAGGTDIKPVSDAPKVWVNTAPANVNDAVGVMRDGGCSSLGGEFVASPEGTSGACQTPTAIVVCANTKNTCSGFADTRKHAASTKKQVKALLKTSSAGEPGATTTPGASTPGGSTTTSGATTTTRGKTPPSTRG